MRRNTLKRAKLNRQAVKWRAERILEIGVCDICGKAPAALIHEIARGVHRVKALMEACAQLATCQPCHDLRLHKGMPVAEQLAWLFHRRPAEFDLLRFWELTGRMWPSNQDVWKFVLAIRNAEDAARTW